jgi:type I restriction enzyme, S subunit
VKLSTARIGDVCELNPSTRFRLRGDDLCSFVPMEAVSDESASIANPTLRPFREVAKGYTIFANGDVIIAKITPCMENGKCAIARNLRNGVGFGSTEFHVLRTTTQVLPEWLFYFWRFPQTRKLAERNMTGTAGQKRVPASFVEGLEIPVPPFSEQKRIAAILGKADRLRRTRRYARQLSDTFLQSAFLEMFGGAIPFVTPGDLEVDTSRTMRFVSDAGAKRSRLVRKGSTLVCCIGATIGKTDQAQAQSAFNQQINAVEWNANVDDDYGLQVMRFFSTEVAARGRSTTLPILKKSEFEEIAVPVPPLPLQQKFAAIVRRFERLRAQQREAERQAEHLFQTLLHRAFSLEQKFS